MNRKFHYAFTAAVFSLLLLLAFSGSAQAQGFLIPKDESLPPLAMQSHRVNITINEQGATTTVDQVFENHTSRDLEAIYIFPLPKGAATTEFSLWMNGKKIEGQVLEKGQARSIYQSIVNRMKDPALLEYIDGKIFKASVYPIPAHGEQRVRMQYAHVVDFDNGTCRYVYPMKTGKQAARTLKDFTLSMDIRSSIPIQSVYSPTHETSLTRDGKNHVQAGFEQSKATLDKDFEMIWTLSPKEVGISLLAHKNGEDGYFMLLVSPTAGQDEKNVLAKDVILVVDTSGSMAGEKIRQAGKALTFCIDALRPEDRFNLITFSDGVNPLFKELVPADEAHRKKAMARAKNLRAAGGTDINSALQSAIKNNLDEKRPAIVVFITDGEPTVGVTRPADILERAKSANGDKWRIYTFGIGNDLNPILLDRLASENGGYADYVSPNREIEVNISSFFRKIEQPVLKEVSLDLGKAETYDLFPNHMPDLFAGNQLVLLGRYKDGANTAAIIEGWRGEAKIGHSQDITFPQKETDNEFLKQLWAGRKTGYLLEEIRLHGSNQELVAEVTRLGTQYGIVTPYTSYLVAPKNQMQGLSRQTMQPMGAPEASVDAPIDASIFSRGGAGRSSADKDLEDELASMPFEAQGQVNLEYLGAGRKGGDAKVDVSKKLGKMKRSERIEDKTNITFAAGKRFATNGRTFIDANHKSGNRILKIQYGSEAYFRLLDLHPRIKDILALGTSIIVSFREGISIEIGDTGKTQVDDSILKTFLP